MFCWTDTKWASSVQRDVERRNREGRVAAEEKERISGFSKTSSRKKTRVGSGSMFTFLKHQPIKSSQILTAPKSAAVPRHKRQIAPWPTLLRGAYHHVTPNLSRPGGSSNVGSTKTSCSCEQRRLFYREDPPPSSPLSFRRCQRGCRSTTVQHDEP